IRKHIKRIEMPTLNSHTITHNLIVFNGVRECFAFAKSHQPTHKPKLGKECVCSNAQQTDNQEERRTPNAQQRFCVMAGAVVY
ncbi:MAG TPA: hypothetical protein PLW77_08910, partial [Bacteroidales bacterium]|nr:hypothetical protein [Bacteroidales bacterium]